MPLLRSLIQHSVVSSSQGNKAGKGTQMRKKERKLLLFEDDMREQFCVLININILVVTVVNT